MKRITIQFILTISLISTVIVLQKNTVDFFSKLLYNFYSKILYEKYKESVYRLVEDWWES